MTYDQAVAILLCPTARDDNESVIASEVVLAEANFSAASRHAASVIAEAVRNRRLPRLGSLQRTELLIASTPERWQGLTATAS